MLVDFDGKKLTINGTEVPALWLRERAASSDQLDQQTKQRLFNPHGLAANLYFLSVDQLGNQIEVKFSDGCQVVFDGELIIKMMAFDPIGPNKVIWKNNIDMMPRFSWDEFDKPKSEFAIMKSFLQSGYVVIENTPTSEKGFFQLAHKFGYIKQTAHGKIFQVISRADYNDLAYQPVALAPHTDMPYSDPTPGVQILQCVINETTGGLSTLVDSLACCEALREEDAQGYNMLASIPVRFEFHSNDQMIVDEKPMLETNDIGDLIGVRYSPRLDYIPLMSVSDTQHFQAARKRLGEFFNSDEFMLRFSLNQGEAIIFDNNRVLHGRSAYDPTEGDRHVQGCYVDRDGALIRYLTLKRDYGFS